MKGNVQAATYNMISNHFYFATSDGAIYRYRFADF